MFFLQPTCLHHYLSLIEFQNSIKPNIIKISAVNRTFDRKRQKPKREMEKDCYFFCIPDETVNVLLYDRNVVQFPFRTGLEHFALDVR